MIGGFGLAALFSAAAGAQGWIVSSGLITLTCLGLLASITFFYFLDTVAAIDDPKYSVCRVSRSSLILMTSVYGMHRSELVESICGAGQAPS